MVYETDLGCASWIESTESGYVSPSPCWGQMHLAMPNRSWVEQQRKKREKPYFLYLNKKIYINRQIKLRFLRLKNDLK